MGLSTRAILLGVATYLVSPLGLALGLGEIKIKSHLNQPLEAEIQLLQTRDLSEQEILVGLGSQEDFIRVGVDRPFFLNDLKFNVDMNSPAGPIIQISSSRLVREPFLNFIVQTQWPSGKLLREYTVLLDLPVFTEAPARAVTAAKAQPAPGSRTPRPTATPDAARGLDGDRYGPVTSTDTLWVIATQARPSEDVTVQQTMLAIQRLNPNAFINNNINLLKKGAVLRLPSVNDIAAFDSRQAKREVANQNQVVKSGVPDAQIDASRSNVDRGASAEQVQGRVKLSSATDVTGSESGSGGGEGEDISALRTELVNTKEELLSTKRENTDLNARVQAMDEQVQTMERLLEVANSDLRKLELALAEQKRLEESLKQEADAQQNAAEQEALEAAQALAEAREAGLQNADETLTDAERLGTKELITDAELDEKLSTDVMDAVESEVVAVEPEVIVEPKAPVEPEPAVIAEPVEEKQAPITPQPTSQKSLIDIIMENLLYIGGGIVLLIGGLVYFLLTRNSGLKDEDFEYEEDFDDADTMAMADEANNSDDVLSTPDTDLEDVSLESLGSELLSGSPASDPLGAADNFIAQAQYAEALHVLDTAEDSSAIQLKRLEIFAKQDNSESFEQQYAAFELDATAEQVEHAQDLRGLLSRALLGAAAGLSHAAGAETEVDDLDTTLQFDSITEADIEAAAAESFDPEASTGDIDNMLDAAVTDEVELELDSPTLETDDLSLDDLEASLELDDEITLGDDLDLDDAVALGSEPTEESISEDLDFTALNLDGELEALDGAIDSTETADNKPEPVLDSMGTEDVEPLSVLNEALTSTSDESKSEALIEEADSADIPAGSLDILGLDDTPTDVPASGLELDQFGADVDEAIAETSVFDTDALDIEIHESGSITEESDELDLSRLSMPETSLDDEPLELGTDLDDALSLDDSLSLDDGLSLDDDLTLGDDLNLDDDVSAEDAPLTLDDSAEDILDSVALPQDEASETLAEVSASVKDDVDSLDMDLDGDLATLSSDLDGDLADLDSSLESLDDEFDLPDSIADIAEEIEPSLESTDADATDSQTEPEALLDESEVDSLTAHSAAEPLLDNLDDFVAPDESVSLDDDTSEADESSLDLDLESLDAELSADLDALDTESSPAAILADLDTDLDASLDTDVSPTVEPEALNPVDEVLPEQHTTDAPAEAQLPEFDADSDDDSEPSFLGDSDEVATKIDLLRVFVDMGDTESALNTLEEIRGEGNDGQKQEAEALFAELD